MNTTEAVSSINKNMEYISRAFMQNNIVIMELSVMEQTLEDYFITITGGAHYV